MSQEVDSENVNPLIQKIAEIKESKKATLGKHTVILAAPRSYTIGYELSAAFNTSRERTWAAALGVCWEAGASLGLPGKYTDTYNVLVYGGKIMDALLERGVAYNDIFVAGAASMEIVCERLEQLTTSQIEGAEKNS